MGGHILPGRIVYEGLWLVLFVGGGGRGRQHEDTEEQSVMRLRLPDLAG